MTDLEYRMQEKDKEIDQLGSFVRHETYWLTTDDIYAIEQKIDELRQFINGKYLSHAKPEQ